MPADGPVPLGARLDAAVVPAADDPLGLQQAQVGLELVPEGFVLFRVREEERDRGRGAFRGRHGTEPRRFREDADHSEDPGVIRRPGPSSFYRRTRAGFSAKGTPDSSGGWKGLRSPEPGPGNRPFDQGAAELAGRIEGELERVGRPVGRADPMVAAIALQNGLELVTGNTTHYQRIQEIGYPLVLHDWRAA